MTADQPSPERMRIMAVGGRSLRVSVREGAPGWTPLLLCNGIGVSLELFQPFVDALDQRRPVVRFDLPGIGGSPAPVVPYHLFTLPNLLAGLLDQLGYARGDVLGISWGGGLAQQFALSRPGRVRRLVLVATGTGALMVPARPAVLLRMLSPRRHRDPGYAARVAAPLYGGSARTDPQVAGDDDPIIPLINGRIMRRLIPHSELHIYRGGHLELAADAGRLATTVEVFLDADPAPE